MESDRKRMADAEAAKDEAATAAEIARIDLEAAEAAAKLNPDDPFAKRRLDVETSRKRSAVQDAAAARKADRELAGLQGEGASLEAIKLAAKETVREFETLIPELMAKITERQEKARADAASVGVLNGGRLRRESIWSAANADTDRLAAEVSAAADKIAEATKTIADANAEQYTLSQKVDVNMLNRQALTSRSRTGALAASSESAAIGRDQAAERARLQGELRDKLGREDEISGRTGELRGAAAKEEADFRKARRGGASQGTLDKELREWQSAAKALSDYAEKSTKVLADLRADVAKVKEALKNLPDQN